MEACGEADYQGIHRGSAFRPLQRMMVNVCHLYCKNHAKIT